MHSCICDVPAGRHVPGCILAHHKPHVFQPRLDSTDDPWSWEARGIPNPDREVSR